MKLIKYFFTIPFSPVSEWKKALAQISTSKNLIEDAIAVFFLMSILSIGFSYVYDTFSDYGYFTIESALTHYFRLVITAIGIVAGIRMVGSQYHLKNISFIKLFIIYVLATGFVSFLSRFVFLYYGDWLMYYSFIGYYILDIFIYVVMAVYIVFGLMPNYEVNFKSQELAKNLPAVFFITAVIFAVNLIYNFVSGFIIGLFYYL